MTRPERGLQGGGQLAAMCGLLSECGRRHPYIIDWCGRAEVLIDLLSTSFALPLFGWTARLEDWFSRTLRILGRTIGELAPTLSMIAAVLLALAGVLPLASGHASIWHPSMLGFNVTDKTFPTDNRPVSPLMDLTFEQWWFHGHLDYPPNPGDIFELPVGKPATTEIACNKGATTWFNSSEGGDIRQGDSPCPNSSPAAYHTTGIDDVKGCALAIAYKSDAKQVQPEDFTVFSVNHTCVWTRFTDFQVPARMPPCPEGGCICGWFWIHSADSGGEQNYMNGFKCNITGSTSDVPLAKPQVARRCGADPDNGKPDAAPGNCTYGAKQPFYWFQKERNNMFEGTYAPPFYLDLYNFKDGAQDDIFVDSYPDGLPPPSPNSTFVPTPNLGGSPSQTQASASATQPSSNEPTPNSASTPTASNSVSLSTLSQTSTFLLSSSLSPELPIATSSLALPTAPTFDTASGFAPSASTTSDSQSAVVSTSTVLSTVVVTVTVSTPTSPPTSAVAPTSASETPSSAVSHSSAAPSTIFLNRPSSTSVSGAVPSSGAGAEGVKVAAINLELSSSSQAAVRPGVLSAAATNAVCKRQLRRKAALRRRAGPSFAAFATGSLAGSAAADTQGLEEPRTLLSRINLPGLRRHRKLQERDSLWHFF